MTQHEDRDRRIEELFSAARRADEQSAPDFRALVRDRAQLPAPSSTAIGRPPMERVGSAKKMRRNALRSARAQKLRDGKLVCLEGFELKSH